MIRRRSAQDCASGFKLGISVVNYFSHTAVRRMVESLVQDVLDTPTILVCVDNSEDPVERELLAELFQQFRRDDLELILVNPGKNRGYGAGNNAAVARALDEGVDSILICNPDVIFIEGSLASVRSALKLGRRTIYGATTWEGDRRSTGLSTLTRWTSRGVAVTSQPSGGHEKEVYPDGHFIAMVAEVWRTLGGFSESYFLYYEEVDLAFRAKALGIRVDSLPNLVIRHDRGTVTGSGEELRRRGRPVLTHASRSSVIFAAQHRPSRFVPVVAFRLALAARLLASGESRRSGWVLRGTLNGVVWTFSPVL